MAKHAFEVMGLDKDFNIVTWLRYTNLQWNRKFYEMGSFSIQISLEQYDSSIKYIYTKDRPEVGKINQVNYIEQNGSRIFALSGYFLENDLNSRVCYINGNTNIVDAPDFVNVTGPAEDVATTYFDAFKDVTFVIDEVTQSCPLGIETKESQGRGNESDHYRQGEYLGDKIHTILKPSKMGYRVAYDFEANTKTFECLKGVDRTQNNEELNNPVIFSTRYGNLKNPNIVWSDADYKNAYIASNSYEENDVKTSYAEANIEPEDGDLDYVFLNAESQVNHSDYSSTDDYIAAIITDGHTQLLDCKRTISFDLDAIEGSYEYMTDFDLGDECSLEIKEIGLSEDAVLTACYEVIKAGTWTLSLEFDV